MYDTIYDIQTGKINDFMEDIAYIEAHKDEPAVLLEEALKEIGL